MPAKFYRDYSDFLSEHFGCKVQKLTVNAGFSCPNRDGTKGYGGCTYCNNQTFNPEYCAPSLSVSDQLRRGREFFARKYPDMSYLANFQVAQTFLDRLAALPAWVMIEYGAESACDVTLEKINRCHTWADTVDAVNRTHRAGIPCGLHLIMGLPGEDEECMLTTVGRVNELPVDTVKFHQLQLVRGTRMARDVEQGLYDIPRFTAEEYADLCVKMLARLRPDIAVERFVSQSPSDLLIYPRWGLKNYQFTNMLNNRLRELHEFK